MFSGSHTHKNAEIDGLPQIERKIRSSLYYQLGVI